MKVFISWSGERSKVIATALKTWLCDVFQDVEAWMSDHDINAGARWNNDINAQLEGSNFGILCLTPENVDAPWILFEAGSLAKIVKNSRVVPYRIGLSVSDISYPLAQFQGVNADEIGTYKLLQSVNDARESIIPDERLKRLFDKWWTDLHNQLKNVPETQTTPSPQRSDRELLEEILQFVRSSQSSNQRRAKHSLLTWAKGITIDKVGYQDMMAMSNADLERYHNQVLARYLETDSGSEELILQEKMTLAARLISERKEKEEEDEKIMLGSQSSDSIEG